MLKPTGHIHMLAAPYTANPVMQIIGKQCYPFDSDAAKETQSGKSRTQGRRDLWPCNRRFSLRHDLRQARGTPEAAGTQGEKEYLFTKRGNT